MITFKQAQQYKDNKTIITLTKDCLRKRKKILKIVVNNHNKGISDACNNELIITELTTVLVHGKDWVSLCRLSKPNGDDFMVSLKIRKDRPTIALSEFLIPLEAIKKMSNKQLAKNKAVINAKLSTFIPKNTIKVNRLDDESYTVINDNNFLDFHIRKEDGAWTLDVFDSKVVIHNDAYLETYTCDSLEEALDKCYDLKRKDFRK